jgi:hypothetical protein
MAGQGNFIFMDYAGYHPADLTEKYSNIKVVFSPKCHVNAAAPQSRDNLISL